MKTYDQGGLLPPGVTTVINDTGEPISEQVEHSRRYIRDTYGDEGAGSRS